jgi:hypothetical protein
MSIESHRPDCSVVTQTGERCNCKLPFIAAGATTIGSYARVHYEDELELLKKENVDLKRRNSQLQQEILSLRNRRNGR